MALAVKVDSFTWNAADVAGTNYDRTMGFDPAFAVVFLTGVSGSTDSCARGAERVSIGFLADGSNRATVIYGCGDAQTTATYGAAHSTVCVALTISTTAGAINGRLDVEARANWPTDSIRFTVDTQTATDRRVSVLAIGGSDITDVAVGSFQEPVATGNQTIAHGLSGTPAGVLFASVGLGTAPEFGIGSGTMCYSIGAFDGTNGWGTAFWGDDANTTMTNVSYAKTGDVIAMGLEGVTSTALASGVSLDGTNITLNWSKRDETRHVFYLAWVGGDFAATSTTTATNTTPFAGPALGFTPQALFAASACRAASTADTPTSHSQISMGAATSASERVAHAALDENGVGTSEVTFALETDAVYANISTASAIQGLMDIVDMTSDPMSLVMDTADPSPSFVGLAVWGGAAVIPPGVLVPPSTNRIARQSGRRRHPAVSSPGGFF